MLAAATGSIPATGLASALSTLVGRILFAQKKPGKITRKEPAIISIPKSAAKAVGELYRDRLRTIPIVIPPEARQKKIFGDGR
jgi:hypothetical protein